MKNENHLYLSQNTSNQPVDSKNGAHDISENLIARNPKNLIAKESKSEIASNQQSLIGRKVVTILLQRAHHSLRIYKQEQSKQVITTYRNHVNLLENVLDPNSRLQNARNDYHRLLQEKDDLMDDENYKACMVIMHAIGSCAVKIHILDHTNPISAPPTLHRYTSVTYHEETPDKDMRNSGSIP